MVHAVFLGPLAHRVEQGTFNPKVPGSSPGRPTGKDLVDSLKGVLGDPGSGALAAGCCCFTGAATGEPVAEDGPGDAWEVNIWTIGVLTD